MFWRPFTVPALLLLLLLPPVSGLAADRTAEPPDRDERRIVSAPGTVITSTTSSNALLERSAAGPDTFDLYGGPARPLRDPDGIPGTGDEYVEGRFETPDGNPAGLSQDPGDWTGVDLTEKPNYWSVDTFAADNLNDNGAGNRAMWCGLPADSPETVGWVAAPGYGDNWNESLLYESAPIADPSQGQTVDLDFVFNHDTEPDFDFFYVEYDSAGIWVQVLEIDGTNRDPSTGDFPVPGVRFAELPDVRPIVYGGDDYGGFGDPRIRIRLRFASDGVLSDQSPLYGEVFDTDGAVQLDDIVLTTSQGSFTEDFEGAGPYLFDPQRQPFFGDFSNVFPRGEGLDPCRRNETPQVNFIDFGQEPPNGPGVSGRASTGGSQLPDGTYVVNDTGGLDFVGQIDNVVVSPEIEWDLPGPEDDGADVAGAVLSFSVYRDNPLSSGIFYVWAVRAYADGQWTPWLDRDFVYFGSTPQYLRQVEELTDLLPPDPEKIQIRLGATSLCDVLFFCDQARTGPWFDDVRLSKFRVDGVALGARTSDLAQDAFPVSGSIDVSDAAARDALDVRFDRAADVNTGALVVPGDSVLVSAQALIPGTEVAELRMRWALRLNPLFESSLRSAPAGPWDEDVVTGEVIGGREVWTGSVLLQPAVSASGIPAQGTYFADLPDADFLYPGDLLHYNFEAVDSEGRVTTLPSNLGGFGQWSPDGGSSYSRTFTVRALPSIDDVTGTQPSILVLNAFGRRGNEEELVLAFGELGLTEGFDWDSYTEQAPTSRVSNGIGAAAVDGPLGERRGHGARVEQLAGYDTIVVLAGNIGSGVLSDGSDDGVNDKGNDLGVLDAWKALPRERHTVYFGDSIASALELDSSDGAAYVTTVMGVTVEGPDVSPAIGGLAVPLVEPSGVSEAFTAGVVAYGGCPGLNTFDHVTPGPVGAFASHVFVDPSSGVAFSGPAAGVAYDRLDGFDRKVDVTFPFGLSAVRENLSRDSGLGSARTRLLRDVFEFLGGPPIAVDAPALRTASLAVHPTPFNPSTQVVFVLPRAGVEATVEVFNARGERVRMLHDGTAAAAELRLDWNGRDDRGSVVGSGVYYVKAVTEGFSDTRKAVLIK